MAEATRLPVVPPSQVTPANVGAIADRVAAAHLFEAYRERKAAATRAAHDADLVVFQAYLANYGVATHTLALRPADWVGVTWGLVEGFLGWMVAEGAAISTINRRLSTVKTYAKLAHRAGVLADSDYLRIRTLAGYSHPEGRHLDQQRERRRVGAKKADPTPITWTQAQALKLQPETPQGRRDALFMCLLLDHGVRVGELVLLRIEHIDLHRGTFTFERPKVGKNQTHQLTADTWRSAIAYLNLVGERQGPLLRGSRKGGATGGGWDAGPVHPRAGAGLGGSARPTGSLATRLPSRVGDYGDSWQHGPQVAARRGRVGKPGYAPALRSRE